MLNQTEDDREQTEVFQAVYTLELGQSAEEVLTELSEKRNMSKSKVIGVALCIYAYLMDEEEKGHKIAITDSNDNILREVNLP